MLDAYGPSVFNVLSYGKCPKIHTIVCGEMACRYLNSEDPDHTAHEGAV